MVYPYKFFKIYRTDSTDLTMFLCPLVLSNVDIALNSFYINLIMSFKPI